MEEVEVIGAIIAVVFGWWILKKIFSGGSRTVAAAAKTAQGIGTFSQNLNNAFKGMELLEARLKDGYVGDGNDKLKIKEIEIKGLFPVRVNTRAAFVTAVWDMTDDDPAPVIALIEPLQDPESSVFLTFQEMHKTVETGEGFIDWVTISRIPPDLLQPPKSGDRKLNAVISLIDLDNRPSITLGWVDTESSGLLWQRHLDFNFLFKEKGYKEEAEHREEAKAISIQIGVAVAMSDGSFDDLEGEAIKAWIKRAVKPYSAKKLEELKNLYNTAFKEAYEAALQNKLTLSELTSRLNRVGDKAVKYDAVALCYDVMKADGEIAPEEIQTIHKVGEVLKLDMKELEKLRDKSIVGFEGKISAESGSFESMIGIKPDWSKDRIHAHLNEQFMKWNNRLNALPEGEERENAQAMLDRIAEYRKSHGGNT